MRGVGPDGYPGGAAGAAGGAHVDHRREIRERSLRFPGEEAQPSAGTAKEEELHVVGGLNVELRALDQRGRLLDLAAFDQQLRKRAGMPDGRPSLRLRSRD